MEILLVEDDLEDAGLTIAALKEGDVARRELPDQAGRPGAVHRRGQVVAEVFAFRRDPAAIGKGQRRSSTTPQPFSGG